MNLMFGLGELPSPPDERDYPIDLILAAGPVTIPPRYRAWGRTGPVPPVLNQGNTPMCVAYASAGMKLWQERRDEGRIFDFDEPWLYGECKKIDGIPNVDGTYLRVAMKILKNQGIPSDFFPNNPERHRIAAYYSVPRNPDTVKQAIYEYGPVLMGTTWFKSWFKLDPDGRVPLPDEEFGGHAVEIWGWDDRREIFYVRNSWGSEWGLCGNYLMPYSYLEYAHDLWKSLDEINSNR